ncbi:MAG: hypothetical protein IJK02_09980 [Clostridia bacterium]|nr:hypothetical protein [Clostridia bacterium]
MKKPMNKVTKRILIALLAIVLLGSCFTFVGLYAHNELTKPRFKLENAKLEPVHPLTVTETSTVTNDTGRNERKTEYISDAEKQKLLPDTFNYVADLYKKAVAADNVETSWHTDAKLKDYSEAPSTPFPEKDVEIMQYILEHADENDKNRVKSLYPQADKVLSADKKGVYAFDLTLEDVTDISVRRGSYNDKNEYENDEYYFVDLTVDPSYIDASSIPGSEVYRHFEEAFASALTADKVSFEVTGVKFAFKIDHRFNELASLEITRSYRVTADVTLTDSFAALQADGSGKAHVELPYEATEKIGFRYYGAYFTANCVAETKGDMQALPARVNVKDEEAKENFSLTFEASDPSVVKIDEDGVMTVLECTDDPVTVTMTLTYKGHTYTDDLTVFITELEVETSDGN